LAKKAKTSLLIALLVLAVVAGIFVFAMDYRTPVDLTFMRDFVITIDPTSETIKAGSYSTTTIYMTPIYTDADVTLSASGLPSGATGTFSSTSLHIAKGTTSTVSYKITTSTSTPKGSYSVKITAKVTLPTSGTPTYYDVYFSLGVDAAPTPTPTPTAGTKVRVAYTWSELNVRYSDGSTAKFSTSKSTVQMNLIQLQMSGKTPTTIEASVPIAINPECVSALPPLDPIYEAWMLYATITVTIQINGQSIPGGEGIVAKVQWTTDDLKKGLTTFPFKKTFDITSYVASAQLGSTITWKEFINQKWQLIKVARVPVVYASNDFTFIHDWSYTVPSGGVPPTRDFAISISPASTEIGRTAGVTRDFSIQLQYIGSFSGTVKLTVSGIPKGITYTLNPQELTPPKGSSTLKMTCSQEAAEGQYKVTITATSGSLKHDVQIDLKVVGKAEPQYPGAIVSQIKLSLDSLTASYAPSASVTVRGQLVDPDDKGLALKTIKVTSDFGISKEVQTDGSGSFSLTFKAPTQQGTYTVTANFAGDGVYKSSTASVGFSVWIGIPDWLKWLRDTVAALFLAFGIDLYALGIDPLWVLAGIIVVIIILWLLLRRPPRHGGGGGQVVVVRA